MDSKQHANIIVLGHTGAGKSSFINYIIGQDLLKTGSGKPITQTFDSYTDDKAFGLPVCIYDSKGLEVAQYSQMSDEIIQFIQKKCENEDIYQWIHTIFYCINRRKARLDESEKRFIQRIQLETKRTVHIVLTNCDNSPNDEAMKKYIYDALGNDIHLYCVSSVAERTRRGTTNQFGRESVIDGIFEVLWQDILHVMARLTATQFSQHFNMVMDEFFILLKAKILEQDEKFKTDGFLDDLRNWLLSDEIKNVKEKAFVCACSDLLRQKIDTIKTYNHAISIIAKQKLSSFIQFFNQYGVAGHFYVNEIALDNVIRDISGILEDTAERIERKYYKVNNNAYFDYLSIMLCQPPLLYNLIKFFKTPNKSTEKYACQQVVDFIKKEFPTEMELERLLFKNMRSTQVVKILSTPKNVNKENEISKNTSTERKKALITVDGNHAEATVTVRNQFGIHARPASAMVRAASRFKSKIQLKAKGRTIDAKSIIMVLSLGLTRDTEITFCADGSDAADAVRTLAEMG